MSGAVRSAIGTKKPGAAVPTGLKVSQLTPSDMRQATTLMVPSSHPSRNSLRTLARCAHALNVSHTDRMRRRLMGEGHTAADVAIVVCAAHAETAGRYSAVSGQLSRESASADEGKKDGGGDGAHAGTRHVSFDLRKSTEVTIT